MDHNDQTNIADQRQPIPSISKGRNQARRERDRARRKRLTTEQKKRRLMHVEEPKIELNEVV
jgi:hypothetical protein